MAYEIPQELEYKEKILFGLTFKQVSVLIISSIISILFYIFTNHQFYAKITVVVILELIGLAFMFLDLQRHIKNIFKFFQNKTIKFGTFKMNRLVGIKKVKKRTINKNLSVIKVSSTNFGIKKEKEKEMIVSTFRKFLNSLDFPVQIFIQTHTVNLEDYLNKYKEKENNVYSDDYQRLLKKEVNDNQLLDRSFFIIIKKTHNLDIQTKVVQDGLSNLKLDSDRLSTKELKDFLATYYGGDFEGKTLSYISPDKIKNHYNYLQVDKQLVRTITVSGYPRTVEAGFLDKIISLQGNFDISLHIEPYDIESMLVNVNRQLQKQLADLYSAKQKGILSPVLEIQAKDTRNILEELQKGKDKLFSVSFYITCRAKNKKELNLITKKIESMLNSIMLVPKVYPYRQLDLYKSASPLANDVCKSKRTLPTTSLSAFFPFTSSFLDVDDDGILFGLNKNNIPIIKDIFSLSNPNGLILAQSGGGKSYLTKLIIARHILNGNKVMIIDPQGEYGSLCSTFGGQEVVLSRNSSSMINPFDLMGQKYMDKRLFLMDFWNVMFSDLSGTQKAFLDKATTRAYSSYRIDETTAKFTRYPIIGNLLKELKFYLSKASPQEKVSLDILINKVSMFTEGVFKFMNRHTHVNLASDLISFNISDLPNQVKPMMMFLTLDFIYNKMKKEDGKKLLIIDEAWSLLNRSQDATYLMEIVKTCRKFGMGILLLNQEVDGLLDSKAGKSVLANTSYSILLRQKSAVIDKIVKTFHLSSTEKELLLSASVGKGLLLLENEHSELHIISSSFEKNMIDTRIEPVVEEIKEEPECDTLNLDNDIYLESELSKEDIDFLKRNGYSALTFMDFYNKRDKYIIKKKKSEGTNHMLMIDLVVKYLKEKGFEPKEFKTVLPDVVVNIKGRLVAFEIETGDYLTTNRKKFEEKVKMLRKHYSDYFFVILDRNLQVKYGEYGKVLTKRNFISVMDKYLVSEQDLLN